MRTRTRTHAHTHKQTHMRTPYTGGLQYGIGNKGEVVSTRRIKENLIDYIGRSLVSVCVCARVWERQCVCVVCVCVCARVCVWESVCAYIYIWTYINVWIYASVQPITFGVLLFKSLISITNFGLFVSFGPLSPHPSTKKKYGPRFDIEIRDWGDKITNAIDVLVYAYMHTYFYLYTRVYVVHTRMYITHVHNYIHIYV